VKSNYGKLKSGCRVSDWSDVIIDFDLEYVLNTPIGSATIARLSCSRLNALSASALKVNATFQLDTDAELEPFMSFFDALYDLAMEDKIANSSEDLLIIRHVNVAPNFQGSGLGLLLITKAIVSFGSGCAVALEPLPTSRRKGVTKRQGRRLLRAYYQKLGFQRFKDGLMFLDPNLQRESIRRYINEPEFAEIPKNFENLKTFTKTQDRNVSQIVSPIVSYRAKRRSDEQIWYKNEAGKGPQTKGEGRNEKP